MSRPTSIDRDKRPIEVGDTVMYQPERGLAHIVRCVGFTMRGYPEYQYLDYLNGRYGNATPPKPHTTKCHTVINLSKLNKELIPKGLGI